MIALIPARGGSKGLPGKNILELIGKPLIAYSIEAAQKSKSFRRIIVSTEDEKIAKVALQFGAEVIWRPDELAQDSSDMIDVILQVYQNIQNDLPLKETHFCLLQPTSPLRHSNHILQCIENFNSQSFRSALSVCENEYSPFKSFRMKKDKLEALFKIDLMNLNRQKLEITYRQNGAIYILPWQECAATKKILHFPLMPYIMPQEESVDIDSLEDLKRAEQLLINQRCS